MHSEQSLQDFFKRALNQPVKVTLTKNAVSLVSARSKEDGMSIRLHHIFQDADFEVLLEVVEFIRTKNTTTPIIREFIRKHKGSINKHIQQNLQLKSQGRYYNLLDIFSLLNNKYFENRLTTSITWGRCSKRTHVKRRVLGSYYPPADLIRINPILDRSNIPFYFIEYIVYHEMLHAELGINETNGRRIIHSDIFKQREKLYHHYHKAITWEKEHLNTVINCKPAGKYR